MAPSSVVSICSLEHCIISRNSTADIAAGHRDRHWPRCPFVATGLSAAQPHVGLAHVNPDRVVHDPVHDRVGMYPAAEPRVPVLLLELGAEDGRCRAVPRLHQLQQHGPELRVRLVEQPFVDHQQPERTVLADELALAARTSFSALGLSMGRLTLAGITAEP